MKSVLTFALILATVSSCSLLRRDLEEPAEEAQASEEMGPLFDPAEATKSVEENFSADATNAAVLEGEVSRLNTKVAALETKLEVMSANLEKVQMQRNQPFIEAQPSPEPTLSVPVADSIETQVSSAPERPAPPSFAPKITANSSAIPTSSAKGDAEFQAAIEIFQGGNYEEAGTQFQQFAKSNPHHILASHAMHWAAESAFRGENLPLALQIWKALETQYPKSAYAADSLAGQARTFEKMGDAAQSNLAKVRLQQRFPKSPALAGLHSRGGSKRASLSTSSPSTEEAIPEYQEGSQ